MPLTAGTFEKVSINMEIKKTWYGRKYAVVRTTETYKNYLLIKRDKTTLATADFDKAGHKRCKKRMSELRKQLKVEQEAAALVSVGE